MSQIDIFHVVYNDLEEQTSEKNFDEVIYVEQAKLNEAVRMNHFSEWEAHERQLAISTFRNDNEKIL